MNRPMFSRYLPKNSEFDAVGALLALGVLLIGVSAIPDGPQPPQWLWFGALVATSALVANRRRRTLELSLLLIAIWLLVHAESAADDPPFQFVAMICLAYALGAYESTVRGLAGVAVLALLFVLLNLARDLNAADSFAGAFIIAATYAVGRTVERARGDRKALRERAEMLTSERERIARDMHDALGHAISIVTLQVGAVRTRLHEDQALEREALLAAENASRSSVAELRRVVGLLRESAPPDRSPASLSDLDQIVSDVRAAGIDLEVLQSGDLTNLPAGIDVAAIRIVQEALTNVMRHAPGSAASLRLERDDAQLEIEIDNSGEVLDPSTIRPGYGFVGIHERVELYGGTANLEPLPGGGFTVKVRIPLDSELGA